MIARFDATTTVDELRELMRLGIVDTHIGRMALVLRGDVFIQPSQCHDWRPAEYVREFQCARCPAWCRRGLDGSLELYEA